MTFENAVAHPAGKNEVQPCSQQARRAIVAVFLPREHLPFIRHWCEHHLAQGWEIFLYDNTGSTGSTRRTSPFHGGGLQRSGLDKRGNNYTAYTAHLDDEQVARAIRDELKGLDITIAEWQPRDQAGNVVHGQVEAYVDFIRTHRATFEWAAFIDVDEYLCSAPGLTWTDLIAALDPAHHHRIVLQGLIYESRWTPDGHPIPLDNLRCGGLQRVGELPAGSKNIIRLAQAVRADIHWLWQMTSGDKIVIVDHAQYYFKHYNAQSILIQAKVADNWKNLRHDESLKI